MTEIPAQPPPPPMPPAGSPRRIYFEQLSTALLSRGLPGGRIGELVAELDQHVGQAGTDPVAELGPVGELSAALAAAESDRSPLLWLLGNLAFAISLGAVIALVGAFLFGRQPGDEVTVHLGIVAYLGVLMLGILLLRLYGSKSLMGKSTFEMPDKKYLLPYLLLVAIVTGLTRNLQWNMTVAVAGWLLVGLVPVATLLVIWSLRRSRIPVPGRVRHLRRLGWGFWGR